MVPERLQRGDVVRVVAPALSRSLVLQHDHSALITRRFDELGLKVTFGRHVDERDAFCSSSIESRVEDLHAAFADPEVRGILTVIGGFNSNELLPHLDWDLIAANPKILCGYSDITALQNAITARTGLVTYSGPHWSTFGMRDQLEPTATWFRQACLGSEPYVITPAETWTDDPWFADQDRRTVRPTGGWWPLAEGTAAGRLVGGNLCTLNLLQGTPYWPGLEGTIVAVEDDHLSDAAIFARDLTSLLQLPDASGIRGMIIGRFQAASRVTRDLVTEIVRRQPALRDVPVLANVDFGHTNPLATLPIGGAVEIVSGPAPELRIDPRRAAP